MQDNFESLEAKPAAHFFSCSIPAIFGMLLTSGIVIIDGLFIGNIIGKAGLASVNLTLPILYFFLGTAIMIGVGGSVRAGHLLGSKNQSQACSHFTLTVTLTVITITALTLLCFLFLELLLDTIITKQELRPYVETYLSTILWFYPAMMVNIVFSIFMRAQGNPGLSLFFGLAGNVLNIILDYWMIARWGMGLRGAALATGISVLIPMGCGIFYFLSRHSVLHFVKFLWNMKDIRQIFYNGSSEMIAQLSVGFTTWMFNRVILFHMGVDGLASYAIVGYIAFVQIMIITGFAIGLAPIVSYSFGAGKTVLIDRILKIAMISSCVTGLICWMAVWFSSTAIAGSFSSGNGTIIAIARSGFTLFTAAFLVNGFNMMITAFFTSIGDAKTSVIIASLRGLLLINLFVLILPRFMGNTGIWISYPLSELVTLCFSFVFLKKSIIFNHSQSPLVSSKQIR